MSETPVLDVLNAYYGQELGYEEAVKKLRRLRCPGRIINSLRKPDRVITAARQAAVNTRWARARAAHAAGVTAAKGGYPRIPEGRSPSQRAAWAKGWNQEHGGTAPDATASPTAPALPDPAASMVCTACGGRFSVDNPRWMEQTGRCLVCAANEGEPTAVEYLQSRAAEMVAPAPPAPAPAPAPAAMRFPDLKGF